MRIEVMYFQGTKFRDTDIEHRTEYPYTKEKREELIDYFMDKGYNVMLQALKPSLGESYLILWVDKYRFQQR